MKKILFILPLLFAVSTQAENTEFLIPSIEAAFTDATQLINAGIYKGEDAKGYVCFVDVVKNLNRDPAFEGNDEFTVEVWRKRNPSKHDRFFDAYKSRGFSGPQSESIKMEKTVSSRGYDIYRVNVVNINDRIDAVATWSPRLSIAKVGDETRYVEVGGESLNMPTNASPYRCYISR